MAITNYTELRDAVISWPDLQGEVDLEKYVDTCISLGEARIYQILRLQGALTTVLYSSSTPFDSYPLPDDCLEVDRVAGPNGESLEYRSADELHRWGTAPALPCFYSIDGRTLVFSSDVTGFTLKYYQRPDPLETTGTSWLLTLAPALFLYAALIEAAIFSKESDQEVKRYAASFESVATRLLDLDWASVVPRSQPIRSAMGRMGRKERIA